AATWLTHSSIAIILLIATFAASGLFPPAPALALVIRPNLGNALLPVLDQLRAPVAQRRAAIGNLLTRVMLAAAILPFAAPLATWLLALPMADSRLAIEFHLALNFVGALVFLPFVAPVAALVEKLLPAKEEADTAAKP